MKKQLIGGILCILLLATIPLTAGQFVEEEKTIVTEDIEPESVLGVTFIAGLILNPEKVGNMVNAKVLLLGYYDRGIIFKDSGFVTGLKNVRFRDSNLLFMSEPNAYGITQVFGICSGFKIGL
jgi:hypothetical protein